MLNIYSKIRTFDDSISSDLNEVLKTTCSILKQPLKDIKFNLYVVSNDYIHKLNLSERGVDRATDVLSFPYLDIKAGDIIVKDKYKFDIDLVDNKLLVGELFICNNIAIRQAKKYNHSYRREFCFLFLHGLLHCLGYDHIEECDRVVMEEMQSKILNKCKIRRED